MPLVGGVVSRGVVKAFPGADYLETAIFEELRQGCRLGMIGSQPLAITINACRRWHEPGHYRCATGVAHGRGAMSVSKGYPAIGKGIHIRGEHLAIVAAEKVRPIAQIVDGYHQDV